MDSRRNKFRPRGRNQQSRHQPWWNQSPSPTQNRPNPFHQRQHGRKSYKQKDDFDYQYGEYGNPYNSRDRTNFFQNQGDNYQNNGNSIKDFFFRESGMTKPPEESPWSEEAQEQAMKKKLSDVANRLKNKLKSWNAEEESETVQNETESDSSFSISDHLAQLANDPQRPSSSLVSEENNKEEPLKRTAHVPKPVLPPQPNQPEIRRRSNEQKERISNDSMTALSKIKDVQRNIQRKVIGELLSMPKTSLQMVLDDPKINPKIELGMSHLVKENRLLLAQKFRNLAESKMTNNEQFKESQFVSDVETLIDPDLAVDLCKLPPELIKQMGAMFQLDFESDMCYDVNPGFSDDNPITNSFVNTDSSTSGIKGNEGLVNVNKPVVQNTPAPKYTKYLKKKTEPQLNVQSEKSTTENVKPLSEILSNLRTTPEVGIEHRRNDVIQSPAKEVVDVIPLLKSQTSNDNKPCLQVRDLMSLLKVGASMPVQNKVLTQEFDRSPLPGVTKEDASLLPKNLNQTFCDNIPLLEKCLESSPLKSNQSVRSDASLPRSEGEVDDETLYPWNINSKLKEKKFFTPKPISLNLRDDNKSINDDQSSLPKSLSNDNDVVPIMEPRITTRKDLFRDKIYTPNSSNGKILDSPDNFNYDAWTSEDDFDIERMNSKDKNENIKEKSKPLSLAEKLKIMEEMQLQRNKNDGKFGSDELRRRERNLKCKNFLEKLDQANVKTAVEFSESPLVEENSNLSGGLLHIQSKRVSDAPQVEKIDKTVQVDIQKNEPITLFSLENALSNYVKNNQNLEPLKKVFSSHVKDLHKNCKKITATDIRFTQTEIKEFESSFTQTVNPPEKVYKSLTTQTDAPVKVIKKPAGTQTVLKSDASSCYGVPIPTVPTEETSENLLDEVKMIEKVVHKLNERKFSIFLKLTNLNNGSLSFASEGDLSTTLLHTITNGDTSVWKHIFNKEQSKPQERSRATTSRERTSHSHPRRHESSKRPHESRSNEKKDRERDRDKDKDKNKNKERYDKKKEERRGSDGGKMKTKAELKSVSESQLDNTIDNLHLKKWVESQDPSKYEPVDDKQEVMSDAGSKRSKKDVKSHDNRSEKSGSENKRRDTSAKSETSSQLKNKKKEPEKSKEITSVKKPEKIVEVPKKSKKMSDDRSPPAKKQALDSPKKNEKRKESEKANKVVEGITAESICRKPEIQQLVVHLDALERDLNDPQRIDIESCNSAGACIVPEVSQVPEIIDLDEDHGEPMEITSTVDELISTIKVDEPEPGNDEGEGIVDDEKANSRPMRPRKKALRNTNDEKTSNRRTRNKSEDSIIPIPKVPDVLSQSPEPDDVVEEPTGKAKRSRKKSAEGTGKKSKKGKAQKKKGKKAITPAIVEPDVEMTAEPEKETEILTDPEKPETQVPPVILQIKRKRVVAPTDVESDSEQSSVPPKNFKKKRRGSKVLSVEENQESEEVQSPRKTRKGGPKRFKRVVSSSDSEVEEVGTEPDRGEFVNMSMLVKDCCVVIRRLNLPINKMINDIPDSENKIVNEDESALVEETKVDDVCDNKLSDGENRNVDSASDLGKCEMENEVVESKEKEVTERVETEIVEEPKEKEAVGEPAGNVVESTAKVDEPAGKEVVEPTEKVVVVEPAEKNAVEQPAEKNEAEQPADEKVSDEPVGKTVEESQAEKNVAVVEEIPKEIEIAEEKLMESDSETIDSTPVNSSIPAVPLPSTTRSREEEKHDDVQESAVTDSSAENMEVDAIFGDSTPSVDTDAPTISDLDLKRGDFDESTISDHSQILAAPNGDTLSRNSEGLPSSLKKRKVDPISFLCHTGVILDVKIIGKHIFAACEDKVVYCYSIKTGKRKKEYAGHNDAVTCIAFLSGKKGTADGHMFTGSLDNHVRSFVIKNSKLAKQSVELTSQVQCLEENWGTVFAGLKNGVVMRLNSKTLKVINPPLDVSRQQSVMALKTIMEGPRRVFIAATRKEPITIRDATTGLLLREINYNFDATVYSLTIDSNNIYCGTSMPTLFSFDFTDGSSTGEYECGPGVLSIKLVQHLIFASSYDGKIYVIDSKTKERIGVIQGPGKMLMAMDIYKNKQIVASSNDGKLETWVIPAYIRNLLKKVPDG